MTYAAPRKDEDGRWLCSVVKSCDEPAEVQSSHACTGCEQIRAEHAASIEAKRLERDAHLASVEALRQQVADDTADFGPIEQAAAKYAHSEIARLGAAIDALTAAHRSTEGEHSHPVFACAKHTAKLPG